MPPWGAAAGYGHFANDMSLTGREISLILSWADGGAPSGVLLVDEDKPPVFIPPLNGWEQGPPDAVINVAADQKIAADSPFRVEQFQVNTGLKQARWLRALQLNPSDRRAIRYAAFYDARMGAGWVRGRRRSQVSAMPAGFGRAVAGRREARPSKSAIAAAMDEASGAGELGLLFPGEGVPRRPPRRSRSRRRRERGGRKASASASAPRRRSRARRRLHAMWPRLGPGARSLEVTRDPPRWQRRADVVGE